VTGGVHPPRVGEVFVLAEDEYLYGLGPVVARISQVYGPVEYRGEPWWHVAATAANGTPDNHGGWQERDLYLRATTRPATRSAPRA
jgi:hypothetical protein